MKKMLIAVAAAAVSAAVYALGPSMYSEPTYSQMERAIAAAKGGGCPTNTPSLYSKPTYSQMERLIAAIGSGGGGGADTNSVRTLIDSSFDGGTQKVNRVVGSFDAVSNRVAGVEAKTEGLSDRFTVISNRVGAIEDKEDWWDDHVDTNSFNNATNELWRDVFTVSERTGELEMQKRDKTDLTVYRKVKDIWTWTNWDNPDEPLSLKAPDDFLAFFNSPASDPIFFKSNVWWGAVQFWPNGKVKYSQADIAPAGIGELSTSLNFAMIAYDETGRNEIFRFGATASRADPTNDTVVAWSDTHNQFVRVATTDLVSYWDDETLKRAKAYADEGGEARPLPPYLHVLDFDDTYPDDAQWYYDHIDHTGYCSSVRRGNEYGRNYDWRYDDSAAFVVRMSPAAGRLASVGVANAGTNLTESVVTSGRWSRYYKCLPGHTVDGINEKGVVCNINVVPTNGTPWEVHGDDPLPEGRGLNMLGACRYVLDNCSTAKDAAEYVAAHAYIPRSMTVLGDSLHMMVADEDETWIVEDATAYKVEYGGEPVMTNRRWKKDVPDPYGAGSEREAIIAAATGPMTGVVSRVWYTNAYKPDDDGVYPWPTEFAGMTDAEGMIPNTETNRLQAWARDNVTQYLPPKRNYGFWQTVHSCVYDITNRTMRIAVQETDDWYTFACREQIQDSPGFNEKDVKFVYDETGTKRLDVDGKIYEAEVEIGGSWVHNWGSGSGKYVYKGHAYSQQYYAWTYNTVTIKYNPSTGILTLPISGSVTNLQLAAGLNPEKGDDFGGPYEIKGNTYTFTKQQAQFDPANPTDSLLKRSTDVIDPATATTTGKAADALAVNTALAGKVSTVNGIAPVSGDVVVTELYSPNKTQKIDGNGDVYVAQFEKGGHWTMTAGSSTYELAYKGRKEGFTGEPYAWESSSKNQWVYYTPTSSKIVINGYHAAQDAPLNLNPESGDDIPGEYTYNNYSIVFTKQQTRFPDEPTDSLLKKNADLVDPAEATEAGKAADALAVKNALTNKVSTVNGVVPVNDNVDVKWVYNASKDERIDGSGDVYIVDVPADSFVNSAGEIYRYVNTSGNNHYYRLSTSASYPYYLIEGGMYAKRYETKGLVSNIKLPEEFRRNVSDGLQFTDSGKTYTYHVNEAFNPAAITTLLRKSELTAPSTNVTAQAKPADAKAVGDALITKADIDALTPLSHEFYDLSLDGEFLRMCVDIARTLGATVTNDVEEAAQP